MGAGAVGGGRCGGQGERGRGVCVCAGVRPLPNPEAELASEGGLAWQT